MDQEAFRKRPYGARTYVEAKLATLICYKLYCRQLGVLCTRAQSVYVEPVFDVLYLLQSYNPITTDTRKDFRTRKKMKVKEKSSNVNVKDVVCISTQRLSRDVKNFRGR